MQNSNTRPFWILIFSLALCLGSGANLSANMHEGGSRKNARPVLQKNHTKDGLIAKAIKGLDSTAKRSRDKSSNRLLELGGKKTFRRQVIAQLKKVYKNPKSLEAGLRAEALLGQLYPLVTTETIRSSLIKHFLKEETAEIDAFSQIISPKTFNKQQKERSQKRRARLSYALEIAQLKLGAISMEPNMDRRKALKKEVDKAVASAQKELSAILKESGNSVTKVSKDVDGELDFRVRTKRGTLSLFLDPRYGTLRFGRLTRSNQWNPKLLEVSPHSRWDPSGGTQPMSRHRLARYSLINRRLNPRLVEGYLRVTAVVFDSNGNIHPGAPRNTDLRKINTIVDKVVGHFNREARALGN